MVYRDLDRLDSMDRDKYNQCIETIEGINDKRSFWKGIKAIEILSNLIDDYFFCCLNMVYFLNNNSEGIYLNSIHRQGAFFATHRVSIQ